MKLGRFFAILCICIDIAEVTMITGYQLRLFIYIVTKKLEQKLYSQHRTVLKCVQEQSIREL